MTVLLILFVYIFVNAILLTTTQALAVNMLGKISAGDILKYLSYFPMKTDFDSSKCQSLFSREIRKILSICRLLNLHREW